MKKLVVRILATTVLSLGLFAGGAAADSVNCGSITNTGPGSVNTITCVDSNNVDVVCNNNDQVVEVNNQNANSGGAFTVNNTTSGGSTSGSSTNSNTVTVALNASCAPQVATTATNTTNTPAVAPAATPPAAAKPAASQIKAPALPFTGSNTAQKTAIESVGGLVTLAAVSQFGLIAYRRFALK